MKQTKAISSVLIQLFTAPRLNGHALIPSCSLSCSSLGCVGCILVGASVGVGVGTSGGGGSWASYGDGRGLRPRKSVRQRARFGVSLQLLDGDFLNNGPADLRGLPWNNKAGIKQLNDGNLLTCGPTKIFTGRTRTLVRNTADLPRFRPTIRMGQDAHLPGPTTAPRRRSFDPAQDLPRAPLLGQGRRIPASRCEDARFRRTWY